MKKRMMSFALVLVLVMGMIPVSASADSYDIGMRRLGSGETYTQMTTSQKMVDMIKDLEGFSPRPYWDVSQWSVGYGSGCGTDRNQKPNIVLTEAQAEALLLEDLAKKYGKIVNDYCASIGRQPSQQQFDALVDFTYNLGGSWTSGCQLTRWLENPTTEMDLVNAMGRWGRVSKIAHYATCMRRIREAIVFLKGEYYLAHGDGDFDTDLSVVANQNLPYYKLVILKGNGGMYDNLSDEIRYYPVDGPYGSFPAPVREGYTLSGWQVTAVENSDVDPYSISADTWVEQNLELTAVWTEGTGATEPTPPSEPDTPTEPTNPADPTEPEETEPEETEPEETEPTEPDGEPDVETGVELPFTDVPQSAWYRKSVEFVYTNGYMNGVSATEFAPKSSVTRGMMVTVLYRIAGSPSVDAEDAAYFSDSQGKYYTDPVGWAKANGIVNGISATCFAPEKKITRQDAMTIFYRYCVEYLGLDGSSSRDLSGFVDSEYVSGYAFDAISWAVDNGIMNGAPAEGGMKLNPRNNLTRAEAAKLLQTMVLWIYESV